MLRNITKYLLATLLTIFIAERSATCQETNRIPKDTVTIVSDTTSESIDTTLSIYKHSPAKAAFLSAVVPGLGQIYNGKGLFWRLPILYAGIATEVYVISFMNKEYQLYHSAYVNYTNYINDLNGNYNSYAAGNYARAISILSGVVPPYDIQEGASSIPYIISGLKGLNDYYKQYLDLNVIIMAGIYFLNIIDATVTAYFFDYNISDDLSLRIRPTLLDNSLSAFGTFGLKLSFNLH